LQQINGLKNRSDISRGRLSFFDGNITQGEFLTDMSHLSPMLNKGETDHSEVFEIYCYDEISKSGENHIHRVFWETIHWINSLQFQTIHT
jgi:hypothetical protein